MNDSCSPRKLDAGFAMTYSNPSVFSTSTMKSEPGFSTVSESASAASGALSAASACEACDGDNGAVAFEPLAGGCAAAGSAGAAKAATAAPRRNLRRSTFEPDFDIRNSEPRLLFADAREFYARRRARRSSNGRNLEQVRPSAHSPPCAFPFSLWHGQPKVWLRPHMTRSVL